jgi:hypothetical protein
MLNHRKTWHFSVKADDEECLQAFNQAMSNPGFKILVAKWTVEAGPVSTDLSRKKEPLPGCIATYQGRGGLIGIMTALVGGQARNEEQNAIGSQITFAVSPDGSDERMECSMWLSEWKTSRMGFIADARFFRSSMNGVEKQLRMLDPTLIVDRG